MRKKILVLLCSTLLLFSGCGSLVSKGAKLLEEEKYEEAAEKFQASIDKEKNLASAYEGLGIAYMELEEHEKALWALEQAFAEGSKESAVLYNLAAVCALQSEQYYKAAEYFERGLALDDASEELTQEMAFNLVVSYEGLGKYQTAKEKLEVYLSDYPDDERALKEQEFLKTQSE